MDMDDMDGETRLQGEALEVEMSVEGVDGEQDGDSEMAHPDAPNVDSFMSMEDDAAEQATDSVTHNAYQAFAFEASSSAGSSSSAPAYASVPSFDAVGDDSIPSSFITSGPSDAMSLTVSSSVFSATSASILSPGHAVSASPSNAEQDFTVMANELGDGKPSLTGREADAGEAVSEHPPATHDQAPQDEETETQSVIPEAALEDAQCREVEQEEEQSPVLIADQNAAHAPAAPSPNQGAEEDALPDEAHDTSAKVSPAPSLVSSAEMRPSLDIHCLDNVQMPAELVPYLSGPDEADELSEIVRAPPVKLTYNNESFWLFATHDTAASDDEKAPLASTSAVPMSRRESNLPLLFDEVADHQLYFGSVDHFIERLHALFPIFRETQMEIRLCVADLSIEIPEDNVYAREVTLHDLDRIHIGCELGGRLHLVLSEAPRFVYRFNTLARHVAKFNSEPPEFVEPLPDEDSKLEADEQAEEAEEAEELLHEDDEAQTQANADEQGNGVDEVDGEAEDGIADDGTTETLLDDNPHDFDEEDDEDVEIGDVSEPFEQEGDDELADPLAAVNGDVSGEEAEVDVERHGVADRDERDNSGESDSGAPAFQEDGDELHENGQGSTATSPAPLEDDVRTASEQANGQHDGYALPRSSSKRSRDEFLVFDDANDPSTATLIPESKKVRAV